MLATINCIEESEGLILAMCHVDQPGDSEGHQGQGIRVDMVHENCSILEIKTEDCLLETQAPSMCTLVIR